MMEAIVPSWESLESKAAEKGWTNARRMAAPFRAKERRFPNGTAGLVESKEGPLVLWRDTFNWCPFCGPTQLMLEEKQIPYNTRKVPLTSYSAPAGEKDPEFLEKVPPKNGNPATSLVPDLTLAYGTPKERTIIADHGHDLLAWIEENFPNHGPRMGFPEGTEPMLIEKYCKRDDALAGALGAYMGADDADRSALSEARGKVYELLGSLEEDLGRHPEGPFLFGAAFTIPDLRLIPWLERLDVLPAHFKGERLLTGSAKHRFPRVEAWLQALRSRPAYQGIRLDNESLCVAHQNGNAALRKKTIPYNLAKSLGGGSGFAAAPPVDLQAAGPPETRGWGSPAAVEAAHALTFARDGVFALAGTPPKDTALPVGDRIAVRLAGGVKESVEDGAADGGSKAATDRALRCVAAALLYADPEPFRPVDDWARLRKQAEPHAAEVASGLCFLRNRIQVPRDMSAPAAATLRETLLNAASSLVGEQKALAFTEEHMNAFVSRRNIRSRF